MTTDEAIKFIVAIIGTGGVTSWIWKLDARRTKNKKLAAEHQSARYDQLWAESSNLRAALREQDKDCQERLREAQTERNNIQRAYNVEHAELLELRQMKARYESLCMEYSRLKEEFKRSRRR